MKAFKEIIKGINIKDIPHLNPTEIYNEGWMIRLLMYYSLQEGIKLEGVNLWKTMSWTSEALISSPFISNIENKEGYTHADIILGDFTVDYKNSGKIEVKDGYNSFGIIEAKMGSNLSQGTTYAPIYNQASRNLACIAHNTLDKGEYQTFFGVVAPKRMIEHHNIEQQVDKKKMIKQIEERYVLSDLKINTNLIKQAEKVNVFVISYEDWISKFTEVSIKNELQEFYDACLVWNKIK